MASLGDGALGAGGAAAGAAAGAPSTHASQHTSGAAAGSGAGAAAGAAAASVVSASAASAAGSGVDEPYAGLRTATPRVLQGHKSKVMALAWNRKGTLLASGSQDTFVRLWPVDAAGNVKESSMLRGHSASVTQLCWNPAASDRLATTSSDKTVQLWDMRATGKPTAIIRTAGENINLCWSPDGNMMCVGNMTDCVSLIDARKNQPLKSFQFTCEVNEMAWHPSGNFLFMATGIKGGTTDPGAIEVRYPREASVELLCRLKAHSGTCYCIDFDKGGQYFATGGADGLVCLFDASDLICLRTFDRLETPVRSLRFSHDSRLLAVGSEEPFVDLICVADGRRIKSIPSTDGISAVAWHPSAYVLAFANEEKLAREQERGIQLIAA